VKSTGTFMQVYSTPPPTPTYSIINRRTELAWHFKETISGLHAHAQVTEFKIKYVVPTRHSF